MYEKSVINSLNGDILEFPQVHPIEEGMHRTQSGVSRMVMLDRYSFKDLALKTLKKNDVVILTVEEDPKFPRQGLGSVLEINKEKNIALIEIEKEYHSILQKGEESGIVERKLDTIQKPLELYYEQIARRNAKGLSLVEKSEEAIQKSYDDFYDVLSDMDFVPAGRILYGAGSETDVTYFNCYVLPYIKDSRGGIAEHREKAMEIMSRGGGVGTNGSTLRPRNTLARGVNGKSSGTVSWLDDISKLTHLVEQG